jgi:glucokinase
MLLAGDIGGTKTNLAIFSPEGGARAPLAQKTFLSAQYPSLEVLVQEFVSQVDLPIDRASFGVAGPVVAGKSRLINLPWVMDERQLGNALNLPSVRLLNDLNAIAHGVPHLEPDDVHTINRVHHGNGGALAVVAPGTGLGQAFLTLDGDRYRVHPSEGGHADFAPADELQAGLYRYLQERCEQVSWERVCSGRGLPNIYDYLRDTRHAEEPSWLAEQLESAPDRTPIIVNAALNPESGCELCIATLDVFMSILGSVAGNFALQVLATGGVYLGGGIPPRILSILQAERFLNAFARKESYQDLLHTVPVHIILHPEVALFGAACHGLELTPD